jgi:hypothetical protein
MTTLEFGLMTLSYDSAQSLISVKWSNELSVESPEFLQTIIALFDTINREQVTNLIVDSGIPAGGTLTEDIIAFFIHNIPNTTLKHIILLESPDYLWDDNLYQVIKLLVDTYKLPIKVELLKNQTAALKWLLQPLAIETTGQKEV